VPARGGRRRPKEDRITVGTVIEKVAIEVTEQQGSVLRVEQITEGLVSVWNRNYPPLQVRLFDEIIQVNGRAHDSTAMLEELKSAEDAVKLIVRRSGKKDNARGSSRTSSSSKQI